MKTIPSFPEEAGPFDTTILLGGVKSAVTERTEAQ
jgi:hypothetical protein